MNEDKATRYHRQKRWVSAVSLAWGLALLAGLIVTGWSLTFRTTGELVAGRLSPWPGVHLLAARCCYLVLVGLVNEAVSLPLAFYSGFVLEHRYGLSTQTVAHWSLERAKGLAIGGAFGLAGVTLLYLAIDRWPHSWWLAAGAGFTLLIIVIAHIFPVLLLPIFYRVTPLARDTLRTRLLALADRARVRVVNAFEWHVSDRTKKANAALAGLGGTRRILVSDTLLDQYSDEEIEVILAHEIGHHVHADIWKGVVFEAVLSLGGFYVAARLLDALAPAARLRGVNDIAGLPVLLLGATAVSLVLVPAANALSRWQERRADAYALRLTGNADAFISAMRRLASQNLAEEQPSWLAKILFHTHPPVSERISAARSADIRRNGK